MIRIKALHSLVIARHQSVKILQIESKKISKADRIKKLNFENKYLFGSKNKEKKNEEAVEAVVEEKPAKNDVSSEIYWTCLHVPEVQDFTKPVKVKGKKGEKKLKTAEENEKKPRTSGENSKKTKIAGEIKSPKVPKLKKEKLKISVDSKKNVENIEEEKVPEENIDKTSRKSTRKLKIVPEFLLPENLASLQNKLPSVKVDITDKLTSSFQLRSIESEPNGDEQDIPFASPQLRDIPNFPLTINKINRIVSEFEKFVPRNSSIWKPSVSKVLQSTMPENQRHALMHWKQLKIAELGLEGFEVMQKSHLTRGKQFHECLQRHFTGETVDESEIAPEVREIWRSIDPLLQNFQTPGVLIEEKLQHPYLYYKGVVDCVSFHNSTLSVIEWKKSDRHKKTLTSTFDAPIQLCSYVGALNASRPEFLKKPIKSGVIVVAYNDGSKADLFEINENELKRYWKVWLSRLQEYWVRFKDNTLPPEI